MIGQRDTSRGRMDQLDYALGGLVKRAVDGEDIKLSQELLEVFDTTSVDSLLGLSGECLVIVCCR